MNAGRWSRTWYARGRCSPVFGWGSGSSGEEGARRRRGRPSFGEAGSSGRTRGSTGRPSRGRGKGRVRGERLISPDVSPGCPSARRPGPFSWCRVGSGTASLALVVAWCWWRRWWLESSWWSSWCPNLRRSDWCPSSRRWRTHGRAGSTRSGSNRWLLWVRGRGRFPNSLRWGSALCRWLSASRAISGSEPSLLSSESSAEFHGYEGEVTPHQSINITTIGWLEDWRQLGSHTVFCPLGAVLENSVLFLIG
jgi:hypothetical protein